MPGHQIGVALGDMSLTLGGECDVAAKVGARKESHGIARRTARKGTTGLRPAGRYCVSPSARSVPRSTVRAPPRWRWGCGDERRAPEESLTAPAAARYHHRPRARPSDEFGGGSYASVRRKPATRKWWSNAKASSTPRRRMA